MRGWLAFLLGFILALGCGTTYLNTRKVETRGGFVTEVEGGSEAGSGLSGVTDLIASINWFMAVGLVAFLLLLWKAPGLFRKIREKRAARAALSHPPKRSRP